MGIPHHVLKKFEKENDPLAAAVNYWLKGNAKESGVPLSWKSIVAALKDDSVGEAGIANEISKKYCQPQDSEDKKGQKHFPTPTQYIYLQLFSLATSTLNLTS